MAAEVPGAVRNAHGGFEVPEASGTETRGALRKRCGAAGTGTGSGSVSVWMGKRTEEASPSDHPGSPGPYESGSGSENQASLPVTAGNQRELQCQRPRRCYRHQPPRVFSGLRLNGAVFPFPFPFCFLPLGSSNKAKANTRSCLGDVEQALFLWCAGSGCMLARSAAHQAPFLWQRAALLSELAGDPPGAGCAEDGLPASPPLVSGGDLTCTHVLAGALTSIL